jgi:hypothetical protein
VVFWLVNDCPFSSCHPHFSSRWLISIVAALLPPVRQLSYRSHLLSHLLFTCNFPSLGDCDCHRPHPSTAATSCCPRPALPDTSKPLVGRSSYAVVLHMLSAVVLSQQLFPSLQFSTCTLKLPPCSAAHATISSAAHTPPVPPCCGCNPAVLHSNT